MRPRDIAVALQIAGDEATLFDGKEERKATFAIIAPCLVELTSFGGRLERPPVLMTSTISEEPEFAISNGAARIVLDAIGDLLEDELFQDSVARQAHTARRASPRRRPRSPPRSNRHGHDGHDALAAGSAPANRRLVHTRAVAIELDPPARRRSADVHAVRTGPGAYERVATGRFRWCS